MYETQRNIDEFHASYLLDAGAVSVFRRKQFWLVRFLVLFPAGSESCLTCVARCLEPTLSRMCRDATYSIHVSSFDPAPHGANAKREISPSTSPSFLHLTRLEPCFTHPEPLAVNLVKAGDRLKLTVGQIPVEMGISR